MSNNPFMDYQEQFFKLWNDNMEQMLNSDAYKSMAKNIPGADAYTKAMEAMVPNIENYWKTMAASMPQMPANPYMDMWKNMPVSNPYMDMWKNMTPSANPFMDYWNKTMAQPNPFMSYWNKAMAQPNPFMEYWNSMTPDAFADYWKNMADPTAFADYWKSVADPAAFAEYWKNMMDPSAYADYWKNFSEYWKEYTDMFPGMKNYWDDIAKIMPNPEKFAELAPFKIPGFEAFTKVFDMWKSFGDPDAMVQDFQNLYMDASADILKSLFPEALQPFLARPVDYMNVMVEYYKQFVSPWLEIDADILQRISKGDMDAYIDFFKEYLAKYEESLEKYFTIMGMGLNRESTEDYMKTVNLWNKAMISMGELLAVISKTSQESFNKIDDKVREDLAEGKAITTFRDFYSVWYSVTEDAFEKLLATDEFSKVFDGFADRYAQFMIAQNKMYERMLSSLPIPTNTDMKSLYKTVYDLRKDVRDLKKAVQAAEEASEKETKKGDK